MRRAVILLSALLAVGQVHSRVVKSPDGSIGVTVSDSAIMISKNGQDIQKIIVEMNSMKQGRIHRNVIVDYDMVSGKRSHCSNKSNECLFSSETGTMQIKVFNDGVAYKLSGTQDAPKQEYVIENGTKRWMQTLKTDYEGFYPLSTEGKTGNVGFPALLQYGDDLFGLITESGVGYGHSGAYLEWNDMNSSYSVTYTTQPGAINRMTGLDQLSDFAHDTPWRVLILGTLSQIVESTLVTDLAEPCQIDDTSWIKPGVSAWIYWAYNHSSKDYRKVTEYIDLAEQMHWPYNLIDWEWDEMANGGNIEDAIRYAAGKGIKANLWYNSGTSWIGNGAPGPQDRLRTYEAREKEMTRLEQLGATGIKVDFFLSDGQDMIEYYLDILRDAARHHLLVDFHGCTVPRGWSRTWPNLMSMEAVYGAEWYNNNRRMTNAAPQHNTTLPFTRNVIGPMDYTPCTFTDSQNPHITTDCHELALPILFESGLQHMADRPEAYLNLPDQVRKLLMGLPAAWDDTRLLGGYPGEYAVLAREKDGVWYVAGINGTDRTMTIAPDFSRIGDLEGYNVLLITDKGATPGQGFDISTSSASARSIECPAAGGFVMKLWKR